MASFLTSAFNTLNNAAHAVAPSMFESKEELIGTIPVPPPQPTREMQHKHYLVPLPPALPTSEMQNKHYLSRDKTIENAGAMLSSVVNYVSEIATDLSASFPSSADFGLSLPLDARGIPIPPPQPTREDMHRHYLIPLAPPMPTRAMQHKHYLIPLAPPMPTDEDMNRHYLSRDRTVENMTSSIRSATTLVSQFATDLRETVVSTVRSAPVQDISSQSLIPEPPRQPTKEMMHKHYLVPVPPPMPTEEQMHKHYLARNKTIENAGNSIRYAATYVSEVATDLSVAATSAILSTAEAASNIPAVAVETGNTASVKLTEISASASSSISSAADTVMDTVAEKTTQLKEYVMPTKVQPQRTVYSRKEVISESPILRKNQPAGSRRITPRQNYEGFKPLIAARI